MYNFSFPPPSLDLQKSLLLTPSPLPGWGNNSYKYTVFTRVNDPRNASRKYQIWQNYVLANIIMGSDYFMSENFNFDLSEPQGKDDNAWFTMIPMKP